MGSTSLLFPFSDPASAAETATVSYTDSVHGFTVQVPSKWEKSTRMLPDRRSLEFWSDPSDAQRTFMFIAYTPVRDDFTSLGSFGSVDQVAAQSILPKGKFSGEDTESVMLSATSAKQAYFFDYTQSVPDVLPKTHFRTIFTLVQGATGGAGAVLVTLTLQTPEERYTEELKPLFDSVIDSYGKAV